MRVPWHPVCRPCVASRDTAGPETPGRLRANDSDRCPRRRLRMPACCTRRGSRKYSRRRTFSRKLSCLPAAPKQQAPRQERRSLSSQSKAAGCNFALSSQLKAASGNFGFSSRSQILPCHLKRVRSSSKRSGLLSKAAAFLRAECFGLLGPEFDPEFDPVCRDFFSAPCV